MPRGQLNIPYGEHHAGDFVKLVKCCEAVLGYDCKYTWLDTGYINKQCSAELKESIRSMFSWYQNFMIYITFNVVYSRVRSCFRQFRT